MKTTNGNTHEDNVNNLGVFITRATNFGSAYNPPRPQLTIQGLTQLKVLGKSAIDLVDSYEISYKNAIAARNAAFNGFDFRVTRVINSLRISRSTDQTLVQAEAMVRELRGKRVSEILTDAEIAAEKAKGNTVKQVTLHNSRIDRKIENFARFVLFLATIPEYKPNEVDLTIEALTAEVENLKALNQAIVTTFSSLGTARMARDKALYAGDTGLVPNALDAKSYVKSVFGATSPEYKQIRDILFVKR
jgi:hypothetical protein